jgi:hypothetical protein
MTNITENGPPSPGEGSPETGHGRSDFVIHFWLDGEPFETRRHELTPNKIIREFGNLDSATHYLVEIEGRHRESFQGKGDDLIKIYEGERFQTISIGPTPVSDAEVNTGVEAFLKGLIKLGYSPNPLPGRPDHLVFDYPVETGSHAAKTVRLGLVIPQDFPFARQVAYAYLLPSTHPTQVAVTLMAPSTRPIRKPSAKAQVGPGNIGRDHFWTGPRGRGLLPPT